MKGSIRIVGYEAYNTYELDWRETDNGISAGLSIAYGDWCFIPGNNFKTSFDNNIALTKDSRVWIHPKCNVLRSAVYANYSKAHDVQSADVVVIPKDRSCYYYMVKCVVFVHEPTKTCIVASYYNSSKWAKIAQKVETGKTKLGDIVHFVWDDNEESTSSPGGFEEAVVAYSGVCRSIWKKFDYFADIHCGIIPEHKVMHEDELQRRMSSNEEVTIDELSSAHDMLLSSDKNCIAVGLRTLASLPYAKYPCSFTFVIRDTLSVCSKWAYSKAMRLTSVNAMLKHLGYFRVNINYSKKKISASDWKLLKLLMKKYNRYTFNELWHMPFMTLDCDMDKVVPILSD